MMKKHVDTLAGLFNYIRLSIKEIYDQPEANQLAYLILEHLLSYSKIDIQMKGTETVTEDTYQQAKGIVNQLLDNKPIQYILGSTGFYGLKLKVDARVLIPRQETEELVDWVVKEHADNSPEIIDIGTGSGCIAIALAKNIHGSRVDGLDISEDALSLADENARFNNVSIDFYIYDLSGTGKFPVNKKYNIIVSNPPYVTFSEKKLMRKNVTESEPPVALYVSDDEPLIFYDKIARFGIGHLVKDGCVYLEINENYGNHVVKLYKDHGYKNIVLKKDINGKDRMVKATIGQNLVL